METITAATSERWLSALMEAETSLYSVSPSIPAPLREPIWRAMKALIMVRTGLLTRVCADTQAEPVRVDPASVTPSTTLDFV